jgi:uncharacterized membrane protein YkoI
VHPVIVFFVLFSASLSATADESITKRLEGNADAAPHTIRQTSNEALKQTLDQEPAPLWIDKTLEDLVIPLQKWLDNDPDTSNKQQQREHAHSIRSAIKSALKEYSGTVLSAEKKQRFYAIKILSKSGTIKIIQVPIAQSSIQPNNLNFANPEQVSE